MHCQLTKENSIAILEKRNAELLARRIKKTTVTTTTTTEMVKTAVIFTADTMKTTNKSLCVSIIPSPWNKSSNQLTFSRQEIPMNTSGYIRLPRSLLQDPRFDSQHAIHKWIFTKIIELACWKQREFNNAGKMITLQPGQLCISYRELAAACGKGVSKRWVEGAIRIFSAVQILGQSVGQKIGQSKMVLTILHKETYEMILNHSRTVNRTHDGTVVGHKLISKEYKYKEKKINKEKKVAYAPDSLPLVLSSFLFSKIKIRDPNTKEPNFQNWAVEMDRLMKLDGRTEEEIRKVIEWLPTHFWGQHIETPNELREKFTKLILAMQPTQHNINYRSSFLEENREQAKALEASFRNLNHPRLRIEVSSSYIEFLPKDNPCYVTHIPFKDKNFQSKLHEQISRFGLKNQLTMNR